MTLFIIFINKIIQGGKHSQYFLLFPPQLCEVNWAKESDWAKVIHLAFMLKEGPGF